MKAPPLTLPWAPEPETPRLGDVLLAAVDAVHGDLPELRLQPPGGPRSSAPPRVEGAAELSADEQRAVQSPAPSAARARLPLPAAQRAVVVLIDGLGWHNLHARAELAPFLTREFTGIPASSTVPSTTAANITYLGTGVEPGQTAMAGYTVRNPGTGDRMNLISWAGGDDPLQWQRVPTVFERLAAASVPAAQVSTWRFEHSGLTQAALRGAQFLAAESLAERVDATVAAMATGTAIAYLYWAEVDAVGHLQGWQSPAWNNELAHVDREISRLVRALPPGTLVLVTADHGMVDVPQQTSAVFGGPARIDLGTIDELARGIDMVAGENRFLHLYTRQGEALADRWRQVLGERAVVLTRSQALTRGLFGPVRSDVAPVIGDVVVAALGDLSIHDRRVVSEGMFRLPGLHGSLTEWERAVPVLSLVT